MKTTHALRMNFNGYGAVPLKSLYMQSLTNEAQVAVFNQLRNIGRNESFSVLVQHNSALHNEPSVPVNSNNYNCWGRIIKL